MDLGQLVFLFMLLGLLFLAAMSLAAQTRLIMAIISVVCFGVATILHLVVITG
jgi:hypothetical protein